MSFNLATLLTESAAAAPDAPLLHAGEHTLTYAQVDAASQRVSASLRARGLVPGDAVALQLPNVPQFVTAYFGALRAGLVVVPLNPLFTAREVAYHLSDSRARLLISSDLSAAGAVPGAAEAGEIDVVVVSLTGADLPAGTSAFDELLTSAPDPDVYATQSDDTAVLLYTSGTTGRPKGAELTHFGLYMNATVSPKLIDLNSADVSLAVLPLFHVFGLSVVLNGAVAAGASIILIPRFDMTAVLDAIEQRRVTVLPAVPTMYVGLLHTDIDGRDLSSLRAAISGGASIPGGVLHGFEDKYGIVVLEGYGLSETASTVTFNISESQRKVLSIGKPIWGVDVRIVDGDGLELPPGPDHVGELVVRGHNVMKGDFGRPDATAEAIVDGWFHTGDLAYRDSDGYFFIVDRLKDLIIRGGYNVYPREVEEVLYSHPDVVEAAVIGRPDERLGEEIVAVVALAPGSSTDADALNAYAAERLAAYKCPREYRLVDELPKGATGKILKRALRE